MGKVLQIRVSAWTYDEDEVTRTWPGLAALAWPDDPNSGPWHGEKRGVLELVTALENGLQFGHWPQKVVAELREGIGQALAVKQRLEEALADWEPRVANQCSYELEDLFTRLNEQAPPA